MFNTFIRFISLFFFGLAVWLIIQEVEHAGFSQLIDIIRNTPLWVFGLAGIFVVLDFIILACYDLTALEYIKQKLPFETVFKTATIGFAVSNTAGHSFASGGAIRYLFYTPLGVSRDNIFILIAFETLTLFMGMGIIYVIATGLSIFFPQILIHSPLHTFYIASAFIIIGFICYLVLIIFPKQSFKIKGVTLKAPSIKLTFQQILIGITDNFLLSLVFYCVLRYYIGTPFLPVFIVFSIAQITAQVSQVPGGLGVLASLFILLFPHTITQKAGILAALFMFRVIYFFIPLLLAGLYLIGHIAITRFTHNRTNI